MSTTTTTFSSTKTSPLAPSPFSAPQRKTMSITQTYFLAHKARAKLSSQAARPDHNLRLLVGHANLLDTLMLELADAEREQESWFNQSVRGANKAQQPAPQKADRHVQWADTVVEEAEEEWHADNDDDSDASSDASSDYSESDDEFDEEFEQQSPASSVEDDEDVLMADAAPLRRVASNKAVVETVDEDAYSTADEEEEEDDDEAYDEESDAARLTLTRSPSHSASPASLSSPASSIAHISSPPELVIEEDSDISSEDDESSMPPSPPAVTLQSFDKKAAAGLAKTAATTAIKAIASPQEDDHDAFDDDSTAHYYLPPRNPARLITALSVY
ncbi:hypothetical protein HMPREF1624_03298 [Sporothrix schenckii ATCC 58251]|uniref:Protein ECM13 n=1 Tax=Sporothrix schenckii (strain ATCC 58251 / de Perez 2211183) TaxID=1391915 RepID=U7PZ03_SPOS1|nr:hypothetical protein HMPREF1624_03298 [Sporothrix schenckii ATCC 58251]